MVDYDALKKALEESGELMVRTGANQVYELHKHNVEFIDGNKMLRIDGGTEVLWLSSYSIESWWIHKKLKD